MDNLSNVGRIASSGMLVQSRRLQVISENMANASSTGNTPGADPYQRKTITFHEMLDDGASLVSVKNIGRDTTDFQLEYDPSHPAADADGFVKRPNVDPLMESVDMQRASSVYIANLNVLDQSRRMRSQLIELLK